MISVRTHMHAETFNCDLISKPPSTIIILMELEDTRTFGWANPVGTRGSLRSSLHANSKFQITSNVCDTCIKY